MLHNKHVQNKDYLDILRLISNYSINHRHPDTPTLWAKMFKWYQTVCQNAYLIR